jgi:hypothetical protein
MPAELINWSYEEPTWLSSDKGKRPGVLKHTTQNLRGITNRFYDEDRTMASYRRDQQWKKLGFGVPAADKSCLDIGNGPAVYPAQYYPGLRQDVKLESSLRRQGTTPSLNLMGFDGPEGFSSTCARPILGGELLSNYTFNDGRSQLMADYNTRFDKFRTVDDKVPFIHSFAHGQSVFESISDPTKQSVVTQNEIRNLYPVLKNPSHATAQSAYSLSG